MHNSNFVAVTPQGRRHRCLIGNHERSGNSVTEREIVRLSIARCAIYISPAMKSAALSLCFARTLMAYAQAESWGVSGTWELVSTIGSGPQRTRWHSAATTSGCMYLVGSQGYANATFQLDTATNVWLTMPSLPTGVLAPAILSYGGLLVLIGGENSFGVTDQVLLISTTNSTGGWRDAAIPGGSYAARVGHKVLLFGGIAYALGGRDDNDVYYNDLWGIDLNSLLLNTPQANGSPASWVQILPSGSPGMLAPRSAFSWDVYGHTTVRKYCHGVHFVSVACVAPP